MVGKVVDDIELEAIPLQQRQERYNPLVRAETNHVTRDERARGAAVHDDGLARKPVGADRCVGDGEVGDGTDTSVGHSRKGSNDESEKRVKPRHVEELESSEWYEEDLAKAQVGLELGC